MTTAVFALVVALTFFIRRPKKMVLAPAE